MRHIDVMKAFLKEGHEAFVVGGAVRDYLRGATPVDIDLTTKASPKKIQLIARENGWKHFSYGEEFGVIVIVIDGIPYEVATTRTEWYGEDSHRPEGVHFGVSLEDDLSRRDFTINAMAMDVAGKIIDPFGGQTDLQAGIIRTVGDPARRYAEDGLRTFRAVRFAARFGFNIERKTLAAIPNALDRVSGLSVERVRDELEKILCSSYPKTGLDLLAKSGLVNAVCRHCVNGTDKTVSILPEIVHLVGLSQNPRHHQHDAWGHTTKVVSGVPADLALRWAALLHDIAKGLPGVRCLNKRGELADHGHDVAGAEIATDILGRLKVHPDIASRAVWLVRNHMTFPATDRKAVIKWLRRLAKGFNDKNTLVKAVRQLLLLRRADLMAGKVCPDLKHLDKLVALIKDIILNVPFYRADLAIKGHQVVNALGAGPIVGKFLDDLIQRVQSGSLSNNTGALTGALTRKQKRAVSL